MRLARELLERNGACLKAIATDLDYANQHTFSRAFKHHYSYPPNEYRKRMKGGASKLVQPSTLNHEPSTRDAGRGTRDAGRGTQGPCPPENGDVTNSSTE